jgi:hypothetical protein
MKLMQSPSSNTELYAGGTVGVSIFAEAEVAAAAARRTETKALSDEEATQMLKGMMVHQLKKNKATHT